MKQFTVFLFNIFFLIWVSSQAYGNDTIKVAAIYALSGVAVRNNASSLEGIYLGVHEINQSGGLLGRRLEILEFDNQSSPIGSGMAAGKAAKSNAIAILGPAWSSHSLAAAKIAQKEKIPMITNVSTNPEVTKTGDYIFRICFTDDFQGEILATFARQDLKALRAVIITNVSSDYSLKLSEIFRRCFRESGGNILFETEYKLNQMPIGEEIRHAADSGADVIFIPGHDESGEIARKLQQAGSASIFLGGDGWASQVFFSRGGSQLKKGYYCTHWSTHLKTRKSIRFKKKYRLNESSAAKIALGYDAVMLLADAVKRSKSLDREQIKQALGETRGFKGVTGVIRFNERGDPDKSAVFMEIKHGTPRYLKRIKKDHPG